MKPRKSKSHLAWLAQTGQEKKSKALKEQSISLFNDDKVNQMQGKANMFVDKFCAEEKELSLNTLDFGNSANGCLSILETMISTNQSKSMFGNLIREEEPQPIIENQEELFGQNSGDFEQSIHDGQELDKSLKHTDIEI